MNKTTSIVFLFLTLVITGCDRCNECKNSVSPNAYLPKLDDKGKPIISASLADFNCGVMPKDIFRYEYVKFNEKYRYSFYDYVYQLDIKTEKDAVDAGLDVTIPTEFLVPIGLGGTFNYDRHRQWRTEYEHERKVIESRDIAYENIKRYADTSITNTWLRCKYLEARTKEKGLHCLFQDAGVSRIILSATYDPYGNNDPSTKIKKITIKGGKLEDSICSSLRPGEKIGTGGKSAYILRERNQLLSVIFETEQKTYDPLNIPCTTRIGNNDF